MLLARSRGYTRDADVVQAEASECHQVHAAPHDREALLSAARILELLTFPGWDSLITLRWVYNHACS